MYSVVMQIIFSKFFRFNAGSIPQELFLKLIQIYYIIYSDVIVNFYSFYLKISLNLLFYLRNTYIRTFETDHATPNGPAWLANGINCSVLFLLVSVWKTHQKCSIVIRLLDFTVNNVFVSQVVTSDLLKKHKNGTEKNFVWDTGFRLPEASHYVSSFWWNR